LDIDQKKKIVSTILSNGLNFRWKVGRKDPRHQLGVDDTLSKIEEAGLDDMPKAVSSPAASFDLLTKPKLSQLKNISYSRIQYTCE
jgi:hypothetical protein